MLPYPCIHLPQRALTHLFQGPHKPHHGAYILPLLHPLPQSIPTIATMAFLHKFVAVFVLIAITLSFLTQSADAAKGPLITNKVISTVALLCPSHVLTGNDC